jgi:hypothetical protein
MGNLESTLSLAKCQTTAAYSVQIKSILDKRHFNVNNVNVGNIALVVLRISPKKDYFESITVCLPQKLILVNHIHNPWTVQSLSDGYNI